MKCVTLKDRACSQSCMLYTLNHRACSQFCMLYTINHRACKIMCVQRFFYYFFSLFFFSWVYNIIKTFIGSLIAVCFSFCLFKIKKKCGWFRCCVRTSHTALRPVTPPQSSSTPGIIMDIGARSVTYNPSSPAPPPYKTPPKKTPKNVRFSLTSIPNSPLKLMPLPSTSRIQTAPLIPPPPIPMPAESDTDGFSSDESYGNYFFTYFFHLPFWSCS